MKKKHPKLNIDLVTIMGIICIIPYSFVQADVDFAFTVTCDMRNFSGPGYWDTSLYYRGVCEAISDTGRGAFMISPGDIDPPWDVYWTIQQYIGSDYIWYPVVGNHESETPEDMDWLRAFNPDGTSLPNIVNIGPPDSEETTYSFDYENTHFVVINEYFDGVSDVGSDGDVVDELYDWLVADLSSTDKTHIFVIGHEPAFPQPDADNGRERHMDDSLNVHPENRDRFWALLAEFNVRGYLCGHTHNYSMVQIDGVWQLDAGHARGIGDSGAQSTFIVIHVTDGNVTYETYRDNYQGGPYTMLHSGSFLEFATPSPIPTEIPTETPTPSITSTPTGTPIPETNLLISPGSLWRYLDDGSDQGAAWISSEFDDSAWLSGNAQFGYGDGDEATVVGYGPDPENKYITTYFRHRFTVNDLSGMNSIRLGILRDDGAVVFINGMELLRTNMPSGPINYQTLAVYVVGDAEENQYFATPLDPSFLVEGENVIAVEIHQIHGASSDLGFDLYIDANPPTPTPIPQCIHNGDIDQNQIITTGDAQNTFYIIFGYIAPTYSEACSADCNDDGEITAGDAQTIFAASLEMGSCVEPV